MKKKLTINKILLLITGFYLCGTVMQNMFASKTVTLGAICFTGGTLISWLVFACMDIITEIWGKKTAINIFLFGAALNVFFSVVGALLDIMPGTNGAGINCLFNLTNGVSLRIAIASPIAFILGNYANTLIMHSMKNADTKNTSFTFMLRASLSTLAGQLIDNGLFFVLAFGPFLKWGGGLFTSWSTILNLIITITLIEFVLEAIFSPLTSKVVNRIKKLEN